MSIEQPSAETAEERAFKEALAGLGIDSDQATDLSYYMRSICKKYAGSKTPAEVSDAFLKVLKQLHEKGQALQPENVMEYAVKLLEENPSSTS